MRQMETGSPLISGIMMHSSHQTPGMRGCSIKGIIIIVFITFLKIYIITYAGMHPLDGIQLGLVHGRKGVCGCSWPERWLRGIEAPLTTMWWFAIDQPPWRQFMEMKTCQVSSSYWRWIIILYMRITTLLSRCLLLVLTLCLAAALAEGI